MAVRICQDSDGREWEVWEAHAHFVDRRILKDRRSAPRSTPERRFRRYFRFLIGLPVGSDWLVFRSGTAKCRLAPVPYGWEHMSDAELCRLKAFAVPAKERNHAA